MTEPEAPASGRVGAAEPTRGERCATAVVVAVVLAPFVVLLVAALTRPVPALGDIALTEIAVRDVGWVHTPLVGVYSRMGWHHPGPLHFSVLALPYRLLGSDGSALAAGAVIANALVAGGSLWILWRRGRLAGVLVGGLVVAVVARSLGGEVAASPWNPNAVVLPMLLFVLAVWSVVCHDRWMLPVVAGTGTFLVQTHIGTGGVAAAGIVTALVVVLRRRRAQPVGRPVWIVTAAVGLLPWVPPLIQAAANRGGNLRAVFEYWGTGHAVTGWSRAARIVVAELAVDAPWISGDLPRRGFVPGVEPGWTLPVVGVVFVVALAVAGRRRLADATRLGAVTVGFALVAWVSTARIVGEPYDYLVRWTELVGVLAALTIAWTALELARGGAGVATGARARFAPVALVSVAVAVTVVATAGAVDASDARLTFEDPSVLDELVPPLLREARTMREPVLVGRAGDFASAGLSAAVTNALVGAGIDARFPAGDAWKVGKRHVVDEARAGTQLVVAADAEAEVFRADPEMRVVVSADRMTPADRAELEALRGNFDGLAEQAAWMEAHPAAGRRLVELSGRAGQAVVVEPRG